MSASTSLSAAPSQLATGAGDAENDRRSSSLSDVGERVEQEGLDDINMHDEDDDNENVNDTEAETERLDESPLKRREYRNVVLVQTADVDISTSRSARERSQSLSEASSPPESSLGDDLRSNHSLLSPQKRKRSVEEDLSEHDGQDGESLRRRKSPFGSSASPKSPMSARQQSSRNSPSSRASSVGGVDSTGKDRSAQAPSNSSAHSDKPASEDEVDMLENTAPLQDSHPSQDEAVAIESNAEDLEADENAEVDLENASKNLEEVAKKRSALDSLSALEKCFATLRDRLFDERLAAANEELSLLQRPDFLHPELLAMKKAVDRHRQQKEKYQRTFLKFKLETLQRECVATKHQIHSQYIQTVRELRDKSLNIVNREFYQVQRERRNVENDVPDALYMYSNDRARQVQEQTAYNKEVSILSGVARYKGFPAAPELRSLRAAESEEDLKAMGIAARPNQTWQHRHGSLRIEAPGPSPLNRQVSSAEEVFLERNAWANPHHPVHQQRFNRQNNSSSQFGSQKNQPDNDIAIEARPTGLIGALSNSSPLQPDSQPVPNGTDPTTRDRRTLESGSTRQINTQGEPASSTRESESTSAAHGLRNPTTSQPRQASPIQARSNFQRDPQSTSNVPKALSAAQASGPRIPSPMRMPVKLEDAQAKSSPAPHKFNSPASAITAGNGPAR